MTIDPVTIAPVTKTITVAASPNRAFGVFTSQIGSWWPHKTHSIGLEQTETVIMESRVGGRLYEIVADGTEHDWGSVLVWEPPHRVTVSWHVGRSPEVYTEVDVEFAPAAAGTRVTLRHRHWERLGTEDGELRDQYDSGWNPVLDRYVSATGS